MSRLDCSQTGLTEEEASSRLEKYGSNALAERKKRTAVALFLSYFRSPLVVILIFAGAVSAILGDLLNAGIIFFVVGMSVLLGFYQESKAETAAAALRAKVRTTTMVSRDGKKREIPVADVVPGDVVFLSAGDIVPADGRLLASKDLFTDQSALTGESFPAEKHAQADTGGEPLERADCVFMGTSVVSGTGEAVMVRTGSATEYGQIARQLAGRPPDTEFDRGLRHFGYLIMQATFMLVVFVFFVNALFKHGVLESMLFAVALAVGLTPELLPMIVTINLSKGALSMSGKGVIVRRLSAIQNFGSMDVLCTDKTGTLTENVITLMQHINADGLEDEKVLLYAYLNSSFQTGLRSPLDDSVLRHSRIATGTYSKIDEIPFDFERKRVSVVVEHELDRFIVVKGAMDTVLRVCAYCERDGSAIDLTPEIVSKVDANYVSLSKQGYRLLAVAYKRLREAKEEYRVTDENGMVFLGIVAFMDPPKQTAPESLQQLKRAGVELKILTGDNEYVTRSVCEKLGFEIKGLVTGEQIVHVDNVALARVVEETNVFARVTPAQKDRIMSVLRHNGHVVGFLGDGINDAASIRTADVGISVDNAVDVAKAAADIILLRKDLTVLVQGVVEGRRTLGNTMKYVMMGTSSNFGNMFSAAGASMFLPFLPMLPSQILLNNLLYDFSELAIPTDNVDTQYVLTPHRWDINFVREFMLIFGPISSLFDFLLFGSMLFIFHASPALFQTGWFLESLSTQTLVIFIIRTSSTFYRSRPSRAITFSSLAVVVFAMILPFTPIAQLMGFVVPPAPFWLLLAAFVVAYLVVAEGLKRVFYRRLAKAKQT
jgi:Mg2+-importing ATPase